MEKLEHDLYTKNLFRSNLGLLLGVLSGLITMIPITLNFIIHGINNNSSYYFHASTGLYFVFGGLIISLFLSLFYRNGGNAIDSAAIIMGIALGFIALFSNGLFAITDSALNRDTHVEDYFFMFEILLYLIVGPLFSSFIPQLFFIKITPAKALNTAFFLSTLTMATNQGISGQFVWISFVIYVASLVIDHIIDRDEKEIIEKQLIEFFKFGGKKIDLSDVENCSSIRFANKFAIPPLINEIEEYFPDKVITYNNKTLFIKNVGTILPQSTIDEGQMVFSGTLEGNYAITKTKSLMMNLSLSLIIAILFSMFSMIQILEQTTNFIVMSKLTISLIFGFSLGYSSELFSEQYSLQEGMFWQYEEDSNLIFYERGIQLPNLLYEGLKFDDYLIPYEWITKIEIKNEWFNKHNPPRSDFAIEIITNDGIVFSIDSHLLFNIGSNNWETVRYMYLLFLFIKRKIVEERSESRLSTEKLAEFMEETMGEKDIRIHEEELMEYQKSTVPSIPSFFDLGGTETLESISDMIEGFLLMLSIVIYSSFLLEQRGNTIQTFGGAYAIVLFVTSVLFSLFWGLGTGLGGNATDRMLKWTTPFFGLFFAIGLYSIDLISRHDWTTLNIEILHIITMSFLIYFVFRGFFYNLRRLFSRFYSIFSPSLSSGFWVIFMLIELNNHNSIGYIGLIISFIPVSIGIALLIKDEERKLDLVITGISAELKKNSSLRLNDVPNLSKSKYLNDSAIHQLGIMINKNLDRELLVNVKEASEGIYIFALKGNTYSEYWISIDDYGRSRGRVIYIPRYSYRLASRSKISRVFENLFGFFFVLLSIIIVLGILTITILIVIVFYLQTLPTTSSIYLVIFHSANFILSILGMIIVTYLYWDIQIHKFNIYDAYLHYEAKVGVYEEGIFLPSWIQMSKDWDDDYYYFSSIESLVITPWKNLEGNLEKISFTTIETKYGGKIPLEFKGANKYIKESGRKDDIKNLYNVFEKLHLHWSELKSKEFEPVELEKIMSFE